MDHNIVFNLDDKTMFKDELKIINRNSFERVVLRNMR